MKLITALSTAAILALSAVPAANAQTLFINGVAQGAGSAVGSGAAAGGAAAGGAAAAGAAAAGFGALGIGVSAVAIAGLGAVVVGVLGTSDSTSGTN